MKQVLGIKNDAARMKVTRLPDKARTRAYMPVGWGGCG